MPKDGWYDWSLDFDFGAVYNSCSEFSGTPFRRSVAMSKGFFRIITSRVTIDYHWINKQEASSDSSPKLVNWSSDDLSKAEQKEELIAINSAWLAHYKPCYSISSLCCSAIRSICRIAYYCYHSVDWVVSRLKWVFSKPTSLSVNDYEHLSTPVAIPSASTLKSAMKKKPSQQSSSFVRRVRIGTDTIVHYSTKEDLLEHMPDFIGYIDRCMSRAKCDREAVQELANQWWSHIKTRLHGSGASYEHKHQLFELYKTAFKYYTREDFQIFIDACNDAKEQYSSRS